jgi:hypothetical protein
MTIDLSTLRQDPKFPDPKHLYDDTGTTKYLWSKCGDESIYIWTKAYYDEEQCVSDQSSDLIAFVDEVGSDEGYTFVHDGTFAEIEKELKALDANEVCEAAWAVGPMGTKDVTPLIDYVKAHPRFEYCPDMDYA